MMVGVATCACSHAFVCPQFLAGGFNEKAVATQVTNGKGAMPAFGGRLSEEDIANVATYVITSSEEGW
jgi:cytochrome c6